MKNFGFIVSHGFTNLKGYVTANDKKEAEEKILNENWNDIIDEYDINECVNGYEIVEIWEDN
jgi:ssRNA-specific RNase YbeY (16S rRNA maturation enzyme)